MEITQRVYASSVHEPATSHSSSSCPPPPVPTVVLSCHHCCRPVPMEQSGSQCDVTSATAPDPLWTSSSLAMLLECTAALRCPTIARTRSPTSSTGNVASCSLSSRSSPVCSSSCRAHPPPGKWTPRTTPRGPRITSSSSTREAPAAASMSSVSTPT
jgi:hypothetical protein